jgi:uncharacterized protein (DUF697 family)
MSTRKDKAKDIIHSATIQAASVAAGTGLLTGAGGADTPALIAIHTKMIYDLGKLFNVPVTEGIVANILGLGAGVMIGITGAKWVASWLPIAGGAICGGISALHTEGFGWTAYKYFEENC